MVVLFCKNVTAVVGNNPFHKGMNGPVIKIRGKAFHN